MAHPGEELCGTQEDPEFSPIQKRKHIIRAFISKIFPAVRVDMIHHETNIFLQIWSKVSFFRKKTEYKFRVMFRRLFLIGSTWIAVKNTGTQIPCRSYSIAFGFENSVPLSTKQTLNSVQKRSGCSSK